MKPAISEGRSLNPQSIAASQAVEWSEADRPLSEIEKLQNENRALQIALRTSNEHGDLLQEHLHRLSASLAVEVRERQATEERLQKLVQAITKEKGDLEIMVDMLIDQGDDSAEEGKKARIDGLTQIANRRRFDEYLSQEWARHLRLQRPLSLLISDIDHFKLYNDKYGHQLGDACLRSVAAVINKHARNGDLAARYGGEEFAVILPNTELVEAVQVAKRICGAVAGAALPHAESPFDERVTVSIGVACNKPQCNEEAHMLVEAADRRLYLAKHRGRNHVIYQDQQAPENEENIG